jgi:hypothetical protein
VARPVTVGPDGALRRSAIDFIVRREFDHQIVIGVSAYSYGESFWASEGSHRRLTRHAMTVRTLPRLRSAVVESPLLT